MNRRNLERIAIVWASSNAILCEVEAEWNEFLIDDVYNFSILSFKKEWTKLNLSSLK